MEDLIVKVKCIFAGTLYDLIQARSRYSPLYHHSMLATCYELAVDWARFLYQADVDGFKDLPLNYRALGIIKWVSGEHDAVLQREWVEALYYRYSEGAAKYINLNHTDFFKFKIAIETANKYVTEYENAWNYSGSNGLYKCCLMQIDSLESMVDAVYTERILTLQRLTRDDAMHIARWAYREGVRAERKKRNNKK